MSNLYEYAVLTSWWYFITNSFLMCDVEPFRICCFAQFVVFVPNSMIMFGLESFMLFCVHCVERKCNDTNIIVMVQMYKDLIPCSFSCLNKPSIGSSMTQMICCNVICSHSKFCYSTVIHIWQSPFTLHNPCYSTNYVYGNASVIK